MKKRLASPRFSHSRGIVIGTMVEESETDNKVLTPKRCASLQVSTLDGRLNAFFANSVNSPSMSMVNVPCCVRLVPDVTREITAQPMRSAA